MNIRHIMPELPRQIMPMQDICTGTPYRCTVLTHALLWINA